MSLSLTGRSAALVLLVGAFNAGAQELQGETAELSYKMGYDIGLRMKELGVPEFDSAAFTRGTEDALNGKDSSLTDEQAQNALAALSRYQQEAMERRRAELARQSEENLKAGEDYLAANGKREGVTTTDSGLQYEVIEMGQGPRPQATDNVTVHYRGTLLDGTEFDSSYSRGEPTSFGLNRVISGWTEGLQLMPVGSKFKFHIPSDLAYGGRSQGSIGPNSTLIFEVELLGIGNEG